MLGRWNKYHHSIWSGLLLTIRTFAGFGIQKVVAVFYGPAGTTLFSHFQNFITIFTQPVQDAVANGLINAFPKKSLQKPQVVGSSLIILLGLFFASGVILFISTQFNHSYFSFSLKEWLLIIPAILLFCFGLIVSAIYVIEKKLKLYSLIFLTQWVVFFVSVLLFDFSLKQFLMYWLVLQALFALILIIPVYSYLKVSFTIDENVWKHFKQFLIMALMIWLSSKWVDFFVREFSIEQFGVIQTGLWQSIVRISEAYRGLVISFLFLSLYPMLSEEIASGSLAFKSLRKYYLQYVLFSFVFLFLVFQFDELILELLYDEQYVAAKSLFELQIMGDVFAFLAFPFSIYLIASVKTKMYIFIEILSASIYISVIVMVSGGIETLVYAHIIRFVCYAIVLTFVGFKSLAHVR